MMIMEKNTIDNQTPHVEMVHACEKPKKIKKYIEKPLSKKDKRLKHKKAEKYERAYAKRFFKERDRRSLWMNVLIGTGITLAVIVLFRYVLHFEMASLLSGFLKPSIAVTAALIVIAFAVLVTDKTLNVATTDPITDYFIIRKGKITSKTKNNHLNKINTRFLMVTLLKLFRKDQIAIIDERIIYGTMEGNLTKDEVALLNFMLDHGVTSMDDFIEVLTEDKDKKRHGFLVKKDEMYSTYKEAILEMAIDKGYVNQSMNKAKLILRAGAIGLFTLALALIAKGQGTLEMIGIFSIEAMVLYLISQSIYAHSTGAHRRIRQLRKERRALQSEKVDVYAALIYSYLFNKEEKMLRNIQKMYENNHMTSHEYSKFSETYNSFNYILDYVKHES